MYNSFCTLRFTFSVFRGVAQFGDVSERRQWRIQRGIRSGAIKSIAKWITSETTILQQEERELRENGSKGSSIQPKIVKPVDTPCFKALLKFSKKAKKWL